MGIFMSIFLVFLLVSLAVTLIFAALLLWSAFDSRIGTLMGIIGKVFKHLWKASPYDRLVNKMTAKVESWSNKLKDKRKIK